MRGAIQALDVFLPLAYSCTAALYALHYAGPNPPAVVRVRRATFLTALGLHAALFALRLDEGTFPASDPWSTLSSVALGLALLYAATSRSMDHAGSGAIVLGVCALMQTLASAFGSIDAVPSRTMPGAVSLFHAGTSTVAASALVLSGLHGWLYLLLFRRMREHRFGPVMRRLPTLRTLVVLTRRSAFAGFLLLTVGINVGIGWAHYGGVASFHYSDPWVVAMLAIWIHFGLVAFSRRIPGLTASRASLAAAIGLSVFVAAGALTLIPKVTFHWRP